jgi:hypothetical protein
LADTINEFAQTDPVSLILVGDILDISLAYMEAALKDFLDLLERLPKFHKIIYVVGNHDHHLWTMHCEHNRVVKNLLRGTLPEKGSIYQCTDLEGDRFELFEKVLGSPTVSIAYPMYKLPHFPIYFTHGHLFGGLYTFVSDVLKPFLPENIPYADIAATVNVMVIEFIYWYIGETGQGMGADGVMEAIYMDSQKGKKSLLYKALKSAVEVLLPDGIVKGFPDAWERAIARWVGKSIINEYVKEPRVISSMDRHTPSEGSRKKALKWAENTIEHDSNITLVTGHTHVSDSFVDESSKVRLYNLGGWLIDEKEPEPDSNVLLIDGDKMELKKVE